MNKRSAWSVFNESDSRLNNNHYYLNMQRNFITASAYTYTVEKNWMPETQEFNYEYEAHFNPKYLVVKINERD